MREPGLQDRYSRRINYLRVSITDRCNLRCTYCMPAQGLDLLSHEDILSYEEILRVSRVAIGLGIEKIRITGGEPLVRRGVVDFIARVGALPGLKDLSLTTNGLLLADMAEELRRAGLRRVNVSLDTLDPTRFQAVARRPGLEQVLRGLQAAKECGLTPVKVNVVAMRGTNDDEIEHFAEFARENGFEVRFIEFMPARPDEWDAARFLTAAEVLEALRRRYDLVPFEGGAASGPSRTFLLPGGGRVGVISPLSEHFCGRCNRLRLTAEGRLRSCLFSERETDLRSILRRSADEAELSRAILDAVHHKPEGHRLGEEERHKCGLAMSRVGG
ncbi:MAG: GTP 3',8-cyclase MoaA [Deltaproteobacteria bacterium]|nr:GTP 3',8-cyclase MoaA [Deltaproteobacteria bacterium]